AEAWDPASYELGRSFPGQTWSQWNGRFRDDVREFVKSDPGKVGDLMTRLYGSSDLFPDDLDDAYHPAQSINYVTSHDGFCLYDLVAYNDKHNLANGKNNPWNQDNETTWLDWDLLEKNSDMFRFFKGMIAFRKAHPSLARSRFWR